jgi:4-amino-4-deoxy-L-arabinose transferase-like glycosyltransferase
VTALAPYDLELQPLDLALTGAPERPPPLRRRLWGRLSRWTVTNRVDLAVVAVLTTLGAAVHLVGMDSSPARFDDEGTYTAYAWAVQNWHRLGHYTYWYAHPPLGWIQSAGWTWMTDAFDRAPYAVAAAREFTFVCKIAAIVLLYLLAKRIGMSRAGAALGVAIFAFSPLSVYFTRAALLDNIVTPWLLAAFFFAASPRSSVRGAVASGFCLAVAVLTKETALLYLPAVLLLLWQHTDRRTRRFCFGLFGAIFVLLCVGYPVYALLKNELLIGEGHVSLEWAVRWQLFDRIGSGSVFNAKSTAHAVVRSWLDQDAWFPRLALISAVPALLIRRTRAVAFAFVIQVVQLTRGGYLPYPYVIAMIPFAALTIAGFADWLFDVGRPRPAGQPGGDGRRRRLTVAVRALLRRLPRPPVAVLRGKQIIVVALVAWLAVTVGHAWSYPRRDLGSNDRDAGKAAALAWLNTHTTRSQYLVVDDSLWVDLVRAGHPSDHVIWFTKLDVDKDVRIPGDHQWAGISYVVLDHQDDLSVHMQADGWPSRDTIAQFPTLGKALASSRTVATFGRRLDSVTIRQVDPAIAAQKAAVTAAKTAAVTAAKTATAAKTTTAPKTTTAAGRPAGRR